MDGPRYMCACSIHTEVLALTSRSWDRQCLYYWTWIVVTFKSLTNSSFQRRPSRNAKSEHIENIQGGMKKKKLRFLSFFYQTGKSERQSNLPFACAFYLVIDSQPDWTYEILEPLDPLIVVSEQRTISRSTGSGALKFQNVRMGVVFFFQSKSFFKG